MPILLETKLVADGKFVAEVIAVASCIVDRFQCHHSQKKQANNG